MRFLDSDGTKLKDRHGNEAVRDIVQFVPFRDFAARGPVALAQETLAELPNQIADYSKYCTSKFCLFFFII